MSFVPGVCPQPLEVAIPNPLTVEMDCETSSVTVCQPEVIATLTNVAANAASVTALAANPNRKGAIFFMDGSSIATLKLGAVASATSFTIRIPSQTYYTLEVGYTGVIDVIWTTTQNGFLRITEFS